MAVIAKITPAKKSVVLRPFKGRCLAQSPGVNSSVILAATQMGTALVLSLGLGLGWLQTGPALHLMLAGAALMLSFMALSGLTAALTRQMLDRPVFFMSEEDGKLVARPAPTAFPLWAEPVAGYKHLRIRKGWWPRKGWRRIFARRMWLVEATHDNPDRTVVSGPHATIEAARTEAEMLSHRLDLPLTGVE
ncbi:MAG: hypothetical protein Alpg2KO_09790 [Alphaproteobacteria bacterium]